MGFQEYSSITIDCDICGEYESFEYATRGGVTEQLRERKWVIDENNGLVQAICPQCILKLLRNSDTFFARHLRKFYEQQESD